MSFNFLEFTSFRNLLPLQDYVTRLIVGLFLVGNERFNPVLSSNGV